MVPRARLVVYKCCWADSCYDSDVLAAIDKDIDDNVDVISISFGRSPIPDYMDHVAIGAFAAMDNGIFLSSSAGNSGPKMSTVDNVAPWITTVGAGTLDRDFPVIIKLGSGDILYGTSLNDVHDSLGEKFVPLIYAGNSTNDNIQGHFCMRNTLISEKVRHKIVICDRGMNDRIEKSFVVKAAGGVGMVLTNTVPNDEIMSDAHLLPTAAVGDKEGAKSRNTCFQIPTQKPPFSFEVRD